ncbi:hypothetical protein CTP10_R52740 [Cupriavidus sp. P-10]|uniref:hypothetical protein n=1 Tax=Cupriavidus sp. P-10 TaxID=2027911 RepID=UPI0011C1D0BA|nr:hypothetical protein [Cupriavidus sp. P-10]BDB27864.1 hypothetical protein CTP10_R52740 [Cupriavidus sp. P-10]
MAAFLAAAVATGAIASIFQTQIVLGQLVEFGAPVTRFGPGAHWKTWRGSGRSWSAWRLLCCCLRFSRGIWSFALFLLPGAGLFSLSRVWLCCDWRSG